MFDSVSKAIDNVMVVWVFLALTFPIWIGLVLLFLIFGIAYLILSPILALFR